MMTKFTLKAASGKQLYSANINTISVFNNKFYYYSSSILINFNYG